MGEKQTTNSAHSLKCQNGNGIFLKAIVIIIATTILFLNDLSIIFADALENDVTSYIIAIPVILSYLIYRKRKILATVASANTSQQTKKISYLPTIAGISLTATSILLYWYGSYTFTPLEYHLFSLPFFSAGLVLILFNTSMLKQLLFPIGFLFFLMPPPAEILYSIGAALSNLSSHTSSSLAQLMGVPITLGSEYGNPIILINPASPNSIQFVVDIACSGVYSLISFAVFAVTIAYIIRDKPWKKIALITIALPIIYLFNILRITALLLIGYQFGENIALDLFHLLGSWILIFFGTILLLLISEKILKATIFFKETKQCPLCAPFTTQPTQNLCQNCNKITKVTGPKINKTLAAKIISILLIVIALSSIQAPVFALTKAPAQVLTISSSGEQEVSSGILPDITNYSLSYVYRDIQFENTSKADFALSYVYNPKIESLNPIWVSVEIASTRTPLHRWESCLINYPIEKGENPKVTEIQTTDIQLSENPPILGRYFVFQYTKTSIPQVVLYWYESAAFKTDSNTQQKIVKISVIGYPNDLEQLPALKNQLVSISNEIVNYWQPIKLWSKITLIISQNGAYLAASTTILLAVFLLIYKILDTKQRKANRKAYEKLSQQNKQIIDTIQATKKRNGLTLTDITNSYRNKTEIPIGTKQMLERLTELEKTGIIKNTVINEQDEPMQGWKALITKQKHSDRTRKVSTNENTKKE